MMNVFLDLPPHMVQSLMREWFDAISIGRLDAAICSTSLRPSWLVHLQKDGRFCKDITVPCISDCEFDEDDIGDRTWYHQSHVSWLKKRGILPYYLMFLADPRLSHEMYNFICETPLLDEACGSIYLRHYDTEDASDESDAWMKMLLKRFPNKVHQLHVNFNCTLNYEDDIVNYQSNIRVLESWGDHFDFDLDLTLVYPNLEGLTIECDHEPDEIIPFVHSKLEYLEFPTFDMDDKFTQILKRFPNVRSFTTSFWRPRSSEICTLFELCPRITFLQVFCFDNIIEEYQESPSQVSFPTITHVAYERSDYSKQEITNALNRMFPNLISLKLQEDEMYIFRFKKYLRL